MLYYKIHFKKKRGYWTSWYSRQSTSLPITVDKTIKGCVGKLDKYKPQWRNSKQAVESRGGFV